MAFKDMRFDNGFVPSPSVGSVPLKGNTALTRTMQPVAPKKPVTPKTDIVADQQAQIAEFKKNMPQISNSLYNQAASNIKSGVVDQQKTISKNASSRGLLYSGLRQGAQSGIAAQGASDMSNARYGINTLLEGQLNDLQGQGINTGLNNYKGLVGEAEGKYKNELTQESQRRQQQGQFLGGAMNVAALGFVLSDKNEKKNIKDADEDIGKFLDSFDAKKYDYKNEEFGKGKQYGLIAQDLEKTEAGKAMIEETEHGKGVNYGKGLATILAAQSFINKRLKKLEGKE